MLSALNLSIFNGIESFFSSLGQFLKYEYLLYAMIGLFVVFVLLTFIKTRLSYEVKAISSFKKINKYLVEKPYINEANLVEFNKKMKKIPTPLKKRWQMFMLNRDGLPSTYMTLYHCVEYPLKTSGYRTTINFMRTFAIVIAVIGVLLGFMASAGTTLTTNIVSRAILVPVIFLVLSLIYILFLSSRLTSLNVDLYEYYLVFIKNLDKASVSLPDYVDYELLFTRKEIAEGIPVLREYLEKRALMEKIALEKAKANMDEREKFDFAKYGIDGSLVLDRALEISQDFLNSRRRLKEEIEKLENEKNDYTEKYTMVEKDSQKKLQAIKENLDKLKNQLEASVSKIDSNYIKKQQDEEKKKRNEIEKDLEDLRVKFAQEIEFIEVEIAKKKAEIEENKKAITIDMGAEFETYSEKVYTKILNKIDEDDAVELAVVKRQKEELEDNLVKSEQLNQNRQLELDIKQQEIDTLNTSVDNLNEAVNRANLKDKKQINKIYDENQELKNKLQEQEAKIAELNRKLANSTQEVEQEQDNGPVYYDEFGNPVDFSKYYNDDGTYKEFPKVYDAQGNYYDFADYYDVYGNPKETSETTNVENASAVEQTPAVVEEQKYNAETAQNNFEASSEDDGGEVVYYDEFGNPVDFAKYYNEDGTYKEFPKVYDAEGNYYDFADYYDVYGNPKEVSETANVENASAVEQAPVVVENQEHNNEESKNNVDASESDGGEVVYYDEFGNPVDFAKYYNEDGTYKEFPKVYDAEGNYYDFADYYDVYGNPKEAVEAENIETAKQEETPANAESPIVNDEIVENNAEQPSEAGDESDINYFDANGNPVDFAKYYNEDGTFREFPKVYDAEGNYYDFADYYDVYGNPLTKDENNDATVENESVEATENEIANIENAEVQNITENVEAKEEVENNDGVAENLNEKAQVEELKIATESQDDKDKGVEIGQQRELTKEEMLKKIFEESGEVYDADEQTNDSYSPLESNENDNEELEDDNSEFEGEITTNDGDIIDNRYLNSELEDTSIDDLIDVDLVDNIALDDDSEINEKDDKVVYYDAKGNEVDFKQYMNEDGTFRVFPKVYDAEGHYYDFAQFYDKNGNLKSANSDGDFAVIHNEQQVPNSDLDIYESELKALKAESAQEQDAVNVKQPAEEPVSVENVQPVEEQEIIEDTGTDEDDVVYFDADGNVVDFEKYYNEDGTFREFPKVYDAQGNFIDFADYYDKYGNPLVNGEENADKQVVEELPTDAVEDNSITEEHIFEDNDAIKASDKKPNEEDAQKQDANTEMEVVGITENEEPAIKEENDKVETPKEIEVVPGEVVSDKVEEYEIAEESKSVADLEKAKDDEEKTEKPKKRNMQEISSDGTKKTGAKKSMTKSGATTKKATSSKSKNSGTAKKSIGSGILKVGVKKSASDKSNNDDDKKEKTTKKSSTAKKTTTTKKPATKKATTAKKSTTTKSATSEKKPTTKKATTAKKATGTNTGAKKSMTKKKEEKVEEKDLDDIQEQINRLEQHQELLKNQISQTLNELQEKPTQDRDLTDIREIVTRLKIQAMEAKKNGLSKEEQQQINKSLAELLKVMANKTAR